MNKVKPCHCGKRSFRADLHIEFCPDCAPDISLAVYRERQQRAKQPELPLIPKTAAELRQRAAQIREDAQFADDPTVHRKEIAEAVELERQAAELEKEVAA